MIDYLFGKDFLYDVLLIVIGDDDMDESLFCVLLDCGLMIYVDFYGCVSVV